MPTKVLIIGGGIGGLAFAHGLQKHNVPFRLFEKDLSQDYRAQGYRIRIAGPAIEALEYLLNENDHRNFELTAADTRLGPIPMLDAITAGPDENTTRGPPPPQGRKPYTVDRTLFREVMLRGLDKDSISFGKAFTHYEAAAHGITAFFADGTSAQGTLLVGADGARSCVRRQYLPNQLIVDTGGRCIYGKSILTSELSQQLSPSLLPRMAGSKDRTRPDMLSLLSERITFPHRAEIEAQGLNCPQDYIYWVLATHPNVLSMTEDESPFRSPEESERIALDVTKDWHPSIRCVIEHQQSGETSVLSLDTCPPELEAWEADARITMLGDSCHKMGPTAGSGANTALRDAHLLCRLLADDGISKETIAKYETEMRQYAQQAIAMSWQGGKHIFGQKSWEEVKEQRLAAGKCV